MRLASPNVGLCGGSPARVLPPTRGLAGWWRADSGLTLRQSGADQFVTAWSDRSGNGRTLTQATAASQFRYIASGHNGRPVLRAPVGSPASMATAAFASAIAQPGTIVAVCLSLPDPMDGTRTITDGTPSTSRWQLARATGPVLGFPAGTSSQYMHAGGGTPGWQDTDVDGMHALRAEFNGASSNLYRDTDAAPRATGSAGTHSLAALMVGESPGASPVFQGDIGEVLLYSVLWTPDEKSAFDRYLSHYWGIV